LYASLLNLQVAGRSARREDCRTQYLLKNPGEPASEHLDFAIDELREMKMKPALERALRHRGLLKA